jgi:subtilisin family serine protease
VGNKATHLPSKEARMEKRWRLVGGAAAVLLLVMWVAGAVLGAPVEKQSHGPAYHPDQILVKFRPDAPRPQIQQTIAVVGLTEVRYHPRVGVHVMRVPPGKSVEETIAALTDDVTSEGPAGRLVQYAEPDYRVRTTDVFPNDPLFPQQWALHNTGEVGCTADCDIDAPEAWQTNTSSCDVLVAVIDTGVDYTHEDLACNIWTNPGEIPDNGLDDDGNGYVDDVHGYDFCNYDSNPMDDNGHGTHVSGTVGACTDNGIGVSGVTWCVQIMALKFLDASGGGWTSDAVAAIEYATMMGARLSSNSWGGGGYSEALRDAIADADAAGILFVAAAGNWVGNTDLMPNYPSCYDLPNIISVAATDCNDELPDFSGYGLTTVDLAAPGAAILSTVPGNGYEDGTVWSGTSMATPHVSGAAALVWGANPSLSHYCVKAQVLSTVDPVPALEGKMLTGGRLNLNNALLCDPTDLQVLPAPGMGFSPGTWNIDVGDPGVITAYVTACCTAEDAAVATSFDNGDPDLDLFDDGVLPDLFGGDGVYSGTWVPGAAGDVNVTITATKTGHNPGIAAFVAHAIEQVCYMYDDTVPFDWEDISGTGTFLDVGGLDGYLAIPEPFDFRFYGVPYEQVWVSSNGGIYFEDMWLDYVNDCIPTNLMNTLIAPWWDDIDYPLGLYYEIKGIAPDRRLIVQWQEAYHWPGTPNGVSFQAILYEATGDIKFQYLDTSFGDAGYDQGVSATVGIQGDPSQGLPYSCDQPVITDGLAILFYRIPCPSPDVLLIQDAYPWDYNSNELALNEAGIHYTTIPSSQLAVTDLSPFCGVMYSSDQPQTYYLNLDANIAKIEEFVANGGTLLAHACDWGWQGGVWEGLYILPGNVQHVIVPSDEIHILDPSHPVVTGLDDAYFYGWNSSTHGYFTGLPGDANIVMEESFTHQPTYLDYGWGAGRVLATMQTVEWGYAGYNLYRPEFLQNELAYLQSLCGTQTCIDFDEAPAPCWFIETTALRDEYAGLGVTFSGPAPLDGAAVLDECGNFGVSGHSPPNFLAVNCASELADGGIPQDPEYLWFSPAVSQVSANVGSNTDAGQLITMSAYDGAWQLLAEDSRTLAPELGPLSVSAPGIEIVEVNSPSGCVWVLDDLCFGGGGGVCEKTIYTPDVGDLRGSVVDVPVMVDDPSEIMGFDITLEYCDAWLSIVDVLAGDCLDPSWSLDWTEPQPGQVRVIGFSLSGPLTGTDPCSLFVVQLLIAPDAPLDGLCQLGLPAVQLSDADGNPIEACADPGTVEVVPIDHLHFYFDAECAVFGAGVVCPMSVPLTIEAHDAGCVVVPVDLTAALSTTCGMTVSPASVDLIAGVWTGSVEFISPLDEVCEDTCALRATTDVGTWDSAPMTLRGKGDLDANCGIEIFDVIRAVNLMFGTPVTPPCDVYQTWAADTDCSAGHPCGNGAVEIFDLIRIVRYMLDGVWPCAAAAAADEAATAGSMVPDTVDGMQQEPVTPARPSARRSTGPLEQRLQAPARTSPVKLTLRTERQGDEVLAIVSADDVRAIAGLDLTVAWRSGSLQFLGAEPGGLLASQGGWLLRAEETAPKAARAIALDGSGSGLSAGAGDLVVLRFAAKGKAKKAPRGFTITAASLSDADGNAIGADAR